MSRGIFLFVKIFEPERSPWGFLVALYAIYAFVITEEVALRELY